ncbi:MAG: hypothetical protein COA96_03145 [SAR86 cluster bacterium]|uniref:Proline hydroxylase n=1 Tax=SAR86 cluster bacterium TaxID=2030880 RepID=A0A2A5B7K0_9GAMM|nr:MAG: hypothetical protein COA96_03145 [SAR86 cluster bacterium]
MSSDTHKLSVDWQYVSTSLDEKGYAVIPDILSEAECNTARSFYNDPAVIYRSKINMARYNFGEGEYKYFAYPLPDIVQKLRETYYPYLAVIANAWNDRLRLDNRWPLQLENLTEQCHEAGQSRPTPLILKYNKQGYNCLHQDLYGPIHFPLQIVVMLSNPDTDFTGGELILVEQRPRMQSRPVVLNLRQGSAAIIPVKERPRRGRLGYHRAIMRHGVSEILEGERVTMGIIFHDAQ